MSLYHTWFTDQELPGIPLEHLDKDGAVVDLSTGWTFSAKIVRDGTTVVVTQTDNMTGAATSPNLTINKWSAATLTAIGTDLDTTLGVTQKNYEVRVYLRRTADTADEVPTSSRPLVVRFKTPAA